MPLDGDASSTRLDEPNGPDGPLDPELAMAAARATAAFRMLVGLVALLAPRLTGRVLFHDRTLPDSSKVALRMFGIRDAALGLGVLLAARRRAGAVRGWVEAGALCDAGDVAAMALDRGHTIRRPMRLLTMAAAVSATASAPVLARSLTAADRPSAAADGA